MVNPRQRLGWMPAAAVLALLIGYPVYRLAVVAGEPGWSASARALTEPAVVNALRNSAWTSAVAATLAVLIGTYGAMATERWIGERAWPLRVGMIGALIVPPFVSALSWEAAYGSFGFLDDAIGVSAGWLEGPLGVVILIAVNVVPLAYLVIAAALRSSSTADFERAARVSGTGPVATFRLITVPLLRPALTSAWLIAFAAGLSSFGVPVVLGTPAGFETMTTRIYRSLVFSAREAAFQEAVVMALVIAAVALVVAALSDARYASVEADGIAAPVGGGPSLPVAGSRGFVVVAWLYLAVTLALPASALVLRALTRGVGMAPVPSNWTLANFGDVLDSRTGEALARSFLLAAAAALISVFVAGVVIAAQRATWRGWGTLASAAFAIPGSAVAVGILLAYGRWLGGTAFVILAAYVAKLMALAHRPIAAAATGIHSDLTNAARASGAPPITVVRRITAPLLAPAVGSGLLLVFLFAVHELTMSSLLHGPGNETLAVVVLDYQQLGDPTVTAALAVVLTVVVLVAASPLLVVRKVWTGGWT